MNQNKWKKVKKLWWCKNTLNKPINTNEAFNSNYIEYESKGDKNKTLWIKQYVK